MTTEYHHKEWAYLAGLLLGPPVCWAAPTLIADYLGYAHEAQAILAKARTWPIWLKIIFHGGMTIAGGFALLTLYAAALFTANAAWLTVSSITDWAAELIAATTRGMIALAHAVVTGTVGLMLAFIQSIINGITWPFRIVYESINDVTASLSERRKQRRSEQVQIRQAYINQYKRDFRSYRAFKKYWRALQRGENPPYPGSDWQEQQHEERPEQEWPGFEERARPQDKEPPKKTPYDAALNLLNLSEPFTKAELGARYKLAMKKAHPDISGDVRLATRINMARDLIMKQKGWK